MLLFSVIIPVYNAAPYLENCLESVRQQAISNWELITVNDASTDNSLKVLQNYQQYDQRIKIIDLPKNKGQGYARNLAIQKATGEYILFLDADDYFSENAFEQLLAALEKKPKTEVFVWGFSTFREGKKPQKERLPQKPDKSKEETPFQLGLLNRKGFVNYTCAYIVKTTFLKKNHICFSEGIFFEDVEFSITLLFYTQKATVLPFVGYHYRKHNASVTGRPSKQKIDDKFTVYKRVKSFLEEKGVFQQYESLYLASFLTFGVFTSFIDYFSLSKKERDEELDQYMMQVQKSKLLKNENLLLLRNIGTSLSIENEKTIYNAYLRAYGGLSAIKNRYGLYLFLTRLFVLLNRLRT